MSPEERGPALYARRLDTEAVATAAGVTEAEVEQAVEAGELRAHINGCMTFTTADVDRWLDRRF